MLPRLPRNTASAQMSATRTEKQVARAHLQVAQWSSKGVATDSEQVLMTASSQQPVLLAKGATLPDPRSTSNPELKRVLRLGLQLLKDSIYLAATKWMRTAKHCKGVVEETTEDWRDEETLRSQEPVHGQHGLNSGGPQFFPNVANNSNLDKFGPSASKHHHRSWT